MSSTCTYVLSIIKHSTLCGGSLRQYRACVGMSSEWKYRCRCITYPVYDPAIRDPYLVSCTFYACWRSLYSFFFKFEEFLIYLYTKGLSPLCDTSRNILASSVINASLFQQNSSCNPSRADAVSLKKEGIVRKYYLNLVLSFSTEDVECKRYLWKIIFTH